MSLRKAGSCWKSEIQRNSLEFNTLTLNTGREERVVQSQSATIKAGDANAGVLPASSSLFSCPSCLQGHAWDSGWNPGTASQGQEGVALGSHQQKPRAPAHQVSGKDMWFPSLTFFLGQTTKRRVFAVPDI